MLWDLWKEVFCKYRDEWLGRRKALGWKRNLSLIMFVLALLVFLVIVFNFFIYPGKPMLF
jgi:hypothetical protein